MAWTGALFAGNVVFFNLSDIINKKGILRKFARSGGFISAEVGMIHKELRKLNRRELIDIIYQMKKNEQQLQEKITALEAAREEKRLRISKAGSVAEAAVAITNVLNAAQEAADLYLHEIACMKADAEREYERIIAQARNTASGDSPAPKVPAVPVPVVRQSEPSRLRKVSQLVRRWKR
jgi:hypothetical protein